MESVGSMGSDRYSPYSHTSLPLLRSPAHRREAGAGGERGSAQGIQIAHLLPIVRHVAVREDVHATGAERPDFRDLLLRILWREPPGADAGVDMFHSGDLHRVGDLPRHDVRVRAVGHWADGIKIPCLQPAAP